MNQKEKSVVDSLAGLDLEDFLSDTKPSNLTEVARKVAAGTYKPERATKGAAAGCKPGSTRHTYVLPKDLIDQLKAIAGYFQKPEVAVVLEFLYKGVEAVKNKYGNEAVTLKNIDKII